MTARVSRVLRACDWMLDACWQEMVPFAAFLVVFISKVHPAPLSPWSTSGGLSYELWSFAILRDEIRTSSDSTSVRRQAFVAMLMAAWPSITNPPAMKDVLQLAVRQ